MTTKTDNQPSDSIEANKVNGMSPFAGAHG
jgi:hypothetical protein